MEPLAKILSIPITVHVHKDSKEKIVNSTSTIVTLVHAKMVVHVQIWRMGFNAHALLELRVNFVKSMWMIVWKILVTMGVHVWTKLGGMSVFANQGMLETVVKEMSMNASQNHVHIKALKNVCSLSMTSTACASQAGWGSIARQEETFATITHARMGVSVPTLTSPMSVSVQLDTVE